MMRLDVDAALRLDENWAVLLRARWMELVECMMFGELAASQLVAIPKARCAAFDCGERVASLLAMRNWIPRPRERLKNALASAQALREALGRFGVSVGRIDRGADRARLRGHIANLQDAIDAKLCGIEQSWAQLSDEPTGDDAQDDRS
jgi:hypothetical protein